MFLAYTCPRGRALIDRRLYLPERTWLADAARCRAAGVPEQAVFATKPVLAAQMITAALEAGIEASWVTGDEVYGQDPRLRRLLEEREVGYVPAIVGSRRASLEGADLTAAEIAARVESGHWHRYSAGRGAKGHRIYAWAWARIDVDQSGYRWLPIRRLPAVLMRSRPRRIAEILRWSQWRRRHQAIARRCHYQRRSQP
ncbi:DDE superfamily endonuclease [Streptosporangium canum]|uniref:DDE superfamily endonuclease n=1 Tax=Streptosporangium canum TaxID=324952 RepID=A0A1I3X4Z7_9ACTN|nr:DDE superfamily endonuclease [Streptosporangium canum]